MGALESWLQPAVVVAVVLHVWRRIEARLDRMDERHRSGLADLRADLTQRMGALEARLGKIEARDQGGTAPNLLRRKSIAKSGFLDHLHDSRAVVRPPKKGNDWKDQISSGLGPKPLRDSQKGT